MILGRSLSRLFSVQATIGANRLVIYSKTYCPYCIRAKSMLSEFKPSIVEVDLVPNGDEISKELRAMTAQGTFPNVFARGEHIGGSTDVVEQLENGSL
jgi:glutaredoxin 3